jgi:drug/metabolite transporter (DMT)-like permease
VARAEGGGWPLPRTLAEWLGVLGGFSFALNNVMLRREAHAARGARGLAMFLGGAWWPARWPLAMAVARPPAPAPGWLLGTAGAGAGFLGGNLALQYGAARLPANATAVIMITEVLFASVSALLLGAGTLTPALRWAAG